jgi:hypothetical protein
MMQADGTITLKVGRNIEHVSGDAGAGAASTPKGDRGDGLAALSSVRGSQWRDSSRLREDWRSSRLQQQGEPQ